MSEVNRWRFAENKLFKFCMELWILVE